MRNVRKYRFRISQSLTIAAVAAVLVVGGSAKRAHASDLSDLVDEVQPKMVKIFGSGGLRRLENYQSGFLVTAEGHILTAWSYVLERQVTVHMFDGLRYQATLVNIDPVSEIAILKIDAGGNLPHFDLTEQPDAAAGTSIWAFSNLYNVATGDEPVSVQQGVISAVTNLNARRGIFNTPYQGRVYVLDAVTNNPGAAGGALVDRDGNLLGMLGKEMKNEGSSSWLNYALPVAAIYETAMSIIDDPNYTPVPVDHLATGRGGPKAEFPMTLERLGIVVVPEVIAAATPPFVDDIRFNSPAQTAGLLRDDLIMFLNGNVIHSCEMLREQLEYIDRDDTVSITVIRDTGGRQEIIDLTIIPDF